MYRSKDFQRVSATCTPFGGGSNILGMALELHQYTSTGGGFLTDKTAPDVARVLKEALHMWKPASKPFDNAVFLLVWTAIGDYEDDVRRRNNAG